MDDGRGGYYKSMVGYLAPYMTPTYAVTSGIERGLTYRFRYRANNCKGWGPFSDELYILAAQKPSAPGAPQRIDSSSTEISLKLFPSTENGGTPVSDYELWRNDGSDGSGFVIVKGYSYLTNGFIVTVNSAAEALVAGRFYQFIFRSKNLLDYSDFSGPVAFGIADKPAKPSAPYEIHQGQIQKKAITIKWTPNYNTQVPAGSITGYYAFMDDGLNG